MKNKVIVTTTINQPTEAIYKFDSFKDWTLIVVGDKKTPKNYKLKSGIYLSPKDQNKIDNKLSKLIGWNCIERRNFGLILANRMKASVIALVDDDNIPYEFWGKNLLIGKKSYLKEYKIEDRVFDPFIATEYKSLWHRGFPLELIDSRKVKSIKEKNIYVDVQADFWNGDPDIDAICRMMYKPSCKFKSNNCPFFSNNYSPFNTQNTFISSSVLRDYFLFPDVGRMHDIWASYYLQYKKNIIVAYNKPSVFQNRNEHDPIIDLNDEFIGLKQNYNLINQLIDKNFNMKNFFSKKALQAYHEYKKHFKNG